MDDLNNKVRVFCSRVRLADFFRQADKLNLKRIAPETAVRVMDSAGLHLTAGEHATVAKGYVDEHGLFDYGRFCNDFSDVRPAGYYERNPEAAAADGGSRASSFSVSPLDGGSAGFFHPLTETERALLEDILARVRHAVSARGLVVKQFLKDYDEHKKGTVTASRFKRELSTSMPFLRPAEIELLAKAYLTADAADVRYMVFHCDVTPEAPPLSPRGSAAAAAASLRLDLAASAGAGGAGGAAATSSTSGRGRLGASSATAGFGGESGRRRAPSPEKTLEYACIPGGDITAIEAAVVRQVFERRLKLWDCFCDWDPKRLNEVARSHFRRGMANAAFIGLSPACIETLADKYALPTDPSSQTIRWIDFVEEVERAFVEPGLEKDPTRTNDSFAHAIVTAPHPRLVRPSLDGPASAAVARALDGIKAAIKRWRIFGLKAPLADYDRCGEGMVTETQFLRVLAMFSLVPGRADERAALLAYFRGSGAKAHMTDYRAFLAEVAGEDEAAAAAGGGGH